MFFGRSVLCCLSAFLIGLAWASPVHTARGSAGNRPAGFDEQWRLQPTSNERARLDDAWLNAPDDSTLIHGMGAQKPVFLNHWQQVGGAVQAYNNANGYYNGRATQQLSGRSPTDVNGAYYVASSGGGLYRVDFASSQTVCVTDNLPTFPTIGAFATAFSDYNSIIVATGDAKRFTGSGIYRTTDAGATWTKCVIPTGDPTVAYQSEVDPYGRDTTFFFATDAGLLRTNDAGVTWTQVLPGVINDVRFSIDSPKVAVAGGPSGVFLSNDGGLTWSSLNLFTSIAKVNLAITTQTGLTRVYALVSDANGNVSGAYVYASGSWRSLKFPADTSGLGLECGSVGVARTSVTNGWRVAMGTGTLFECQDASVATPTWTSIIPAYNGIRNLWSAYDTYFLSTNEGPVQYYWVAGTHAANTYDASYAKNIACEALLQPIGSLAVSAADSSIAFSGCRDIGAANINLFGSPAIYKTNYDYVKDVGAANFSVNSPANEVMSYFDVSGSGPTYFCLGSKDAFKTTYLGIGLLLGNYTSVASAVMPDCESESTPGYANWFYSVSNLNTVWNYYNVSDNGGTVGTILNSGNPYPSSSKQCDAALSPAGDNWYISFANSQKVYHLSSNAINLPATWVDITPSFSTPANTDAIIVADKVGTLANGIVYYTSGFGQYPHALISNNYGVNWVDVTGDVASVVPGAHLYHLLAYPGNRSILFLSTSAGVLRSDNNGANWYKWMIGLPGQVDAMGMAMSYNSSTGYCLIYIGTNGRGWWARPVEAAQTASRTYTINLTMQNSTKTNQPIQYDIVDLDEGTSIHTSRVAANPTVSSSFALAPDHYSVRVKGPTWLSQSWTVDLTGANQSTTVSLLNGDVDGNNIINIIDYAALSNAFNTIAGSASYDVRADLDGNGAVNIIDYGILSDNFNKVGS